jgi:hypothetical protein
MNSGIALVNELLSKIVNEKARNIKLGHGSFLTVEFGKDYIVELQTNKGLTRSVRGEWSLWVYLCAWRLDQNLDPLVGSADDRELIEPKIQILENKKLLSAKITSNSFDLVLDFEDNITLYLFSFQVADHEQWLLYTPEKKTFIAGPSNTWTYEES